MITRDK
jgi:hypothetical protein